MPPLETLVFDAAPLIALSTAGFLPHVPRLSVRAIVAEEVRDEVLGQGRESGTPEQLLLKQMIRDGELVVRRVHPPKRLRNEIMIHEQVIDAPPKQFAERRVVEVRMNVRHRSGSKEGFDP